MKQISNNQDDLCHYVREDDDKEGRMFNYVLNSKRAQSKLLKGAKRSTPLEVEVKEGCVTFLFNDRSYYEILLPLLKVWHQQVNQTIFINEIEIRIEKSDIGFEDTKKHVDTKLVIFVNSCRLVLHAYNSTQKLMIQGKNYESFAVNCLVPFFTSRIEEDMEQINKFNDKVIDTLGTKKSQNCPQCPFKSTSNSNLKVHMKSCHTKPGICSPQRNKVPKILDEDISLLDESEIKAIEYEEIPENCKITEMEVECEWISCGFKAKTPSDLSKHIEDTHMDYLRAKYLPIEDKNSKETNGVDIENERKEEEQEIQVELVFSCNKCDFETELEDQLNEHHRINVHNF